MDNRQKAHEFLTKFFESRPKSFFKNLDERSKGLHVILRLLDNVGGTVVAGYIAEELNMSTPRVAAALKALEGKGYIVRSSSADDRRKTVVTITEKGRAATKRDEDALIGLVSHLFDTVGEKDLNEFLRISSAISGALDNMVE
ncbi:MAG: MarR family transcriptional regulator [Clostridiales bacterium]|nr:MarR family transcriptional regulator [Clostridiales bacterium]